MIAKSYFSTPPDPPDLEESCVARPVFSGTLVLQDVNGDLCAKPLSQSQMERVAVALGLVGRYQVSDLLLRPTVEAYSDDNLFAQDTANIDGGPRGMVKALGLTGCKTSADTLEALQWIANEAFYWKEKDLFSVDIIEGPSLREIVQAYTHRNVVLDDTDQDDENDR